MEQKNPGYKNSNSSSAININKIKLNLIPNKSIINDIINSSEKKFLPHNFSNIYEGRCLYPNSLYDYYDFVNQFEIPIYSGGFGHGYYHEVRYNVSTQKYLYYLGDGKWILEYETDSWDQLHKYVSDYCEKLFAS
jgi:hypothetical protein